MTMNKKEVIQVYTNSSNHLEIKRVAKQKMLSVSKLCELVMTEYVKDYLSQQTKKEALIEEEKIIAATKLRNLRGY